MKKNIINRSLSLLMCICMVLTLIPQIPFAANASGTTCVDHVFDRGVCRVCMALSTDEVRYLDYEWQNNQLESYEKYVIDYSSVTSDTTELTDGYYVVKGEVTLTEILIITGDVHLILCDGCKLTAPGVRVSEGNSFTVYGQSTDEKTMGSLISQPTLSGQAGIGGFKGANGVLVFNGGNIYAQGQTSFSAGIGGGSHSQYITRYTGEPITINGGVITAVGGKQGAGIGGGFKGNGGTCVINGGIVTASSANNGSGIGGGREAEGGDYIQNGGVVFAIIIRTDLSPSASPIGQGSGVKPTGTTTFNGGITFQSQGNQSVGYVNGSSYRLAQPFTIPSDFKLIIQNNQTLTVSENALLSVNGSLVNQGTLENNGGILLDGGTFTQEGSGSCGPYAKSHPMVESTCGICNSTMDVPRLANGIYSVTESSHLYWLAEQINAGNLVGDINVVLANDVSLPAEQAWTPIRLPDGQCFHLDGNGKTLTIEQTYQADAATSDGNYGLFQDVNYSTFKNLVLRGSITCNTTGNVGAIAGSAYRTTFENVVSYVTVTNTCETAGNVGGIVGYYGGKHDTAKEQYSQIRNCAVYADVTGYNAGGLVGKSWNGTQYYDILGALYAGDVTATGGAAGAIVGYQATDSNTCTFTNVFWNEKDGLPFYGKRDTTNQIYNNTAAKTAEAFTSGEIAWLLNNGVTDGTQVWYQTLGLDEYPGISGATVYRGYHPFCIKTELAYSNTKNYLQDTLADHSYVSDCDTTCKYCDNVRTASAEHTWTWSVDEHNHTQLCEICGEEGSTAEHTMVYVDNHNTTHSDICTVCQYENKDHWGNHIGYNYVEKDNDTHDWFCDFCDYKYTYSHSLETEENEDGSLRTYCRKCSFSMLQKDGVYMIGTAEELLRFARQVNDGGETDAKAIVTADIDMNGMVWTPICSTAAYDLGTVTDVGYTGTFDGNGYTIRNFKVEYEEENGGSVESNCRTYGLFGTVSGTVKNVVIDDFSFDSTAYTQADCRVGGIAGQLLEGGKINDCLIFNSDILTNQGIAGGIAGCNYGGIIENCAAYLNTVTGDSRCAGIVGNSMTDSGAASTLIGYVNNCYCEVNPVGEQNGGEAYVTNCHWVTNWQFASGEVACQLGSAWGQTLGVDDYPTVGGDRVYYGYLSCAADAQPEYTNDAKAMPEQPDHTAEYTAIFEWPEQSDGYMQVYVSLYCPICDDEADWTYVYDDGITVESNQGIDCLTPGTDIYTATCEYRGVTYTDTKSYTAASDNHSMLDSDGFCAACGGYETAVWDEEEYLYEIRNAGQLYWYAEQLNGKNREIYVKLMNDIVIPENAPNWVPINASYAYFDGNNKTISGLKCISENSAYVGLFGMEGWWYEISNLHITNSYFKGSAYVGAVVAYMTNGGSITNCSVTNTTVTGGSDMGTLVGCLSSGRVINCYVDTATLVGDSTYGNIENSYYLSDTETEDGGKTAAQFASGEVAYLLQSNIPEEDIYDDDWNVIGTQQPHIWGQTIGTDAYPVLGGMKVYQNMDCSGTFFVYGNEIFLAHSFKNGLCTNCGEADPDYGKPSVVPTIGLKYPTVSFEDVIIMNVYYVASDLQDVVEMGLITNTVKPDVVSIENADAVIPGYGVEGEFYFSATSGIAPKDIGDTIYFAVYAKLADGTVVYTKMIGYSPKTYAVNQLTTGSAEMRPLVAAMLNYGAAAQTYFNYKTDALVNATMTDEQKAMAEAYRADMIASVTQVTGAKVANFVNDKTYSQRYPTISFEGAFCINYYFQPSLAVVGDVTMYIWSLEDCEAADVLTKENATKAVKMELTESGEYMAVVDGIAAKDLDKAAYVSFVYSDGTTEHCGGVIAYTIGMYCKSQASGTGALSELAKACAVYGYYAKQLFNK